MKKKVKIIAAGALALVIALSAVFTLLNPRAVRTETLETAPLTQTFREEGTLLSRDSYTVEAKSSGTVRSLLVPVGERVLAGAPILSLDDADYWENLDREIALLRLQEEALSSSGGAQGVAASLSYEQLSQQLFAMEQGYDALFGQRGQAKQAVEAAKSQFDSAANAWAGADQLLSMGAISQADYTALEGGYLSAQAAYDAALYQASEENRTHYAQQIGSMERQVAIARDNRGNLQETSRLELAQVQIKRRALEEKLAVKSVSVPFDGVVGSILVKPGDYVTEHQPLATVHGSGARYVQVSFLDEDAYQIPLGQTVTCQMSDGSTLTGTVTFVSSVVEEVASSIGLQEERRRVEITIPNLPDTLSTGGKVQISCAVTLETDLHTVSAGAVFPQEGGFAVYVVEGGKLRLFPVETGLRGDGRVAVVGELPDGARVVLDPYEDGLKPGMRVKSAG